MDTYANQLIAILLVSLRIAPTFGFAPPFTLLRTPVAVRLLLSMGIALWIVAAHPAQTTERLIDGQMLISAIMSELLLGVSMALSLQLAFAAILVAGRAVDFQVGFGLATLADPTLRTQMPLVGTLFAYAAGAVFFATGGPSDLLAIWARSVEHIPIGAFAVQSDLSVLLSFISSVFILAIGLPGYAVVTLFLLDIAIALLSRTLPQMNVLVLGFQVKTIALLVTLPFVFAFSGALFLRIVRLAIDNTARFT